MSWIEIIVLSIVQGLTEFLPVSSSAHLVFVPELFGWTKTDITFVVATHFGTLFAVLIYFRKEIIKLIKDWFLSIKSKQNVGESRLAWSIIVATIPAGIAGMLFGDLIEKYLYSSLIIGYTTIMFGIVLFLADKLSGTKSEKDITLYIALAIGLAQVFALIPGVSRSGITLSIALLLGFSRVSAARFSFLLSIPIILAASGLETIKLVSDTNPIEWSKLLFAVIISFVSGYLCIYSFLAIIARWTMTPFVVYRLILGVVLLLYFWQ